jgi:cytochrome c biogenesis protein ResB
MWVGLLLIIVLTVLSIYGAFIGAERAKQFFNQPPLVVYWTVMATLLIVGFAAFHRLLRVPGLLLMHAGCVLILAGGMWSSQAGHNLQKKLFGIDKIPSGQMAIYEGQSENHVMLDGSREQKELPFSIKLNDFKIEYYKPKFEYLDYEMAGGMQRVTAEIGRQVDLGAEQGTAKITRKFRNLKVSIEGDKREYYDDPSPNSNPALEVQITKPDGQVAKRFIYSLHPEFSHSPQSSYDDKAARYTVLQVVSDTGVRVVFAGYWMLCIGVVWHMWLRHLLKKIGGKKQTDGN